MKRTDSTALVNPIEPDDEYPDTAVNKNAALIQDIEPLASISEDTSEKIYDAIDHIYDLRKYFHNCVCYQEKR